MEESVSATQERNKELDAVVWWIVAFTSFFHSIIISALFCLGELSKLYS